MSDVKTGEISAKLLSHNPSGGDDEYAVKLLVQSTTDRPTRFSIKVQGIDRDGFEAAEVRIRGDLGPGEVREVTDRGYMANGRFASIVRWQIKPW